jgi:hypothetical protein
MLLHFLLLLLLLLLPLRQLLIRIYSHPGALHALWQCMLLLHRRHGILLGQQLLLHCQHRLLLHHELLLLQLLHATRYSLLASCPHATCPLQHTEAATSKQTHRFLLVSTSTAQLSTCSGMNS